MTGAPLILTLTLDANKQQYFNALRQEHFPSERNYLDAHLTLFHHLPAGEIQIDQAITDIVSQYTTMPLQVTGIKSIGNGIAFTITCTELQILHKHLQQQWNKWLTPQDSQKLWPHITVQNKVDADTARRLKEKLEHEFTPFEALGIGLSLFEYQGGPWKFIQKFEFTGEKPMKA